MVENNKLSKKELEKQHKDLMSTTKKALKKLENQTRKQTATAIITAFTFLLALVWRDVISSASKKIISFYAIQASQLVTQFYAAIFTTLLAVLGILLVNKILVNPKD